MITVTNDTYITSDSICELLRKLSALDLGVPITIVLDNARYQKCALVTALAASLQIELCYLPAYSPNLNLIERLWKFVKKQSLYSKYYADFTAFKTAISDCLRETHTTHKTALDSLLTLRFQIDPPPAHDAPLPQARPPLAPMDQPSRWASWVAARLGKA